MSRHAGGARQAIGAIRGVIFQPPVDIGGDDFVCLLENSLENCEKLCNKIIKKFDEEILNFYNEKDRKSRYIEAVDRRGNKDLFSLTSLSVAGIYGVLSVFNDAEEIALKIAAIKKKVKKVNGSCYSIESLD